MILTEEVLDEIAGYFNEFLKSKYPPIEENTATRKLFVLLYDEFMAFLIEKTKT